VIKKTTTSNAILVGLSLSIIGCDFGGTTILVHTFADNTQTITGYEYTDDNCTIPATPAVIEFINNVVFTGGTTETDLGLAQHMDFTLQRATFDGVEASEADLLDLQDIGAFDTTYSLALISDAKLYLADESGAEDGSSPETRPTKLDTSEFFVRQ